MKFKGYLKQNAQEVDKAQEKILSDFIKQTIKTNPKLLPFAKKFKNACYGGKKIRGVLVKMGYEIAKGSSDSNNEILKIGAAFEILHTSLLIHDDIIDQSPQRRGKASLYMDLGGDHYGVSQAISLGDIGLYLPIKIITQTNFPQRNKLNALNYFSQILINTGWGQVMDVEKGSVNLSSKNPDKNFVNLFKTAKYTIAGPLQIGAIFAGAGDSLIKNLGEFGENTGLAFQLKDDILDGETASASNTYSEALGYTSKAKKLIPQISKDREMAELLKGMCDFVVERKK